MTPKKLTMVLACRFLIYYFSMTQRMNVQVTKLYIPICKKQFMVLAGRVKSPQHLENWQDSAQVVLATTLIVSFRGQEWESADSIFSMLTRLLYHGLFVDFAVFSSSGAFGRNP